MSRSSACLVLPAALLSLTTFTTAPTQRAFVTSDRGATGRKALLAAEDARVDDPQGLAILRTGLESPDSELRRVAVRALGRFERPALVSLIARFVEDISADVRIEAVNALGQSVQSLPAENSTSADDEAVVDVSERLLKRLDVETDPAVRGVLAATLGRLPYRAANAIRRTERVVAAQLAGDADPAVLLGSVAGLESLARRHAADTPLASGTTDRLRTLLTTNDGGRAAGEDTARMRRLAIAALTARGAIDAATVRAAATDEDPQVRRLAALALGVSEALDDRASLIGAALEDVSPMVRYEALRAYGRGQQSKSCEPIVAAVDDPDVHVSLLALDLLGNACPAGESPAALLARVAGSAQRGGGSATGSAADRSWHKPAHAIVSLAVVAPARAAGLLARFGEHAVWQVRMYAARAAATVQEIDWLRTLAHDDHPNVRTAAVSGLVEAEGHAADSVFLEALESTDYQLIRTAARALEESADRRSGPALLAALARLTVEDRDTSRDPRLAILERLRELGSRRNAGVLRPYLEDFDPRVAASTAETLTAWTGSPHEAATVRMRTGPAPALGLVADLVWARIEMQHGGTIELTLHPSDAPATVARFVQLARDGYYDGLTFHRVVPNFVIQGGSPGANEFAGDGPYMRDEVGLRPHIRGAVGISTRGRDTGDAQIFINLADNPRLDHGFTVFANVSSGMDIVDQIVEGDVIRRIEIAEE